jgi:hypothetical protein
MNGLSSAFCRLCYWNASGSRGEPEKPLEAGETQAHRDLKARRTGDSVSSHRVGKAGLTPKRTEIPPPHVIIK